MSWNKYGCLRRMVVARGRTLLRGYVCHQEYLVLTTNLTDVNSERDSRLRGELLPSKSCDTVNEPYVSLMGGSCLGINTKC